MRADYTLLKTVVYEVTVVAEDYDDAIEKATALDFWTAIQSDIEVVEVEPIKGPDHVDH